jgi:hypothetical protein
LAFKVTYHLVGGSGGTTFAEMTSPGGFVVNPTPPKKEGYALAGWNTFDNPTIITAGETIQIDSNIDLYAVWMPACTSCKGAGGFANGYTCGYCTGTGKVEVYKCPLCSSTRVTKAIYGYGGTIFSCGACGHQTTSMPVYRRDDCTHCENGITSSTSKCTTCSGKGYFLDPAPSVDEYTSNSVTLLKMEGYEYSKDGISWQSSNEFEGLSSKTSYTFYQRRKATAEAPAGETSKGVTIKTR